jgi:ABC-2 type transport system permease protein
MATLAARRSVLALPAQGGAYIAIAGRAVRDARIRTLAFVYIFGLTSYLQPVAYRHTYATSAERIAFAHSFAHNKAIVLFYGKAYDLLTVGGYSAWRVGGTLAIFAAVFGLLAAVRGLRTEEDAGRAELVLAAPVARRKMYAAAMAAAAMGVVILWLAELAGLTLGRLPVGESAYLALATVSVVPVFTGAGALVSQLAPNRRGALELGGAIVGLCFLLRVVADTSTGAGWVRWTTPLGWAEELRPFTGARPLVMLLPLAAGGAMLLIAARVAASRDVGTGLLSSHDSTRARLGLLSSPMGQALRGERSGLVVWLLSVAALAFVIGVISRSISSAGIPKRLVHELSKLGAGSILHPAGYVAFAFSFFVLAVSLFCVAQVAAAWHEESEERLETLLSLPVGRIRWLGGRLVLAVCAAVAIALAAGAFAWLGAVSQGVSLSLPKMLEAGVNTLPAAILFLGVVALAYAALPRASVGVGYGLVTLAYLWQLFGSLLAAPHWLVKATPFAHVGLVPVQQFRAGDAAVMLAIGLTASVAALAVFSRRDVVGP